MSPKDPNDRSGDAEDVDPVRQWQGGMRFAQAQGVLMQLWQCSPKEAGHRLTAIARRAGVSLEEVVTVVRHLTEK
jgi:hypothetical protein